MSTAEKLKQILSERIMIIDGAMGTMIQEYKLGEAEYRGEIFRNAEKNQQGNNDLLVLSQPQIIKSIHKAFLEAGADIIETNTFNANRISMADYGMENQVTQINLAAARIAKEVADELSKENPDKPRFVAGAMGPTNKTASLSPDVNQPEYRAITFKELADTYYEQGKALIEGGVDILMIETVFDTLNCKAALFGINSLKEDLNSDIPVMVSGTIVDSSGRTLSGQTPEAFWISISHGNIFSVGLNCALGADLMKPHISELSKCAWVYTSAYPNAGLPNEFGAYDETPETMAASIESFLENHWVNIIGGCCGTTPEHIKLIAETAGKYKPRKIPELETA